MERLERSPELKWFLCCQWSLRRHSGRPRQCAELGWRCWRWSRAQRPIKSKLGGSREDLAFLGARGRVAGGGGGLLLSGLEGHLWWLRGGSRKVVEGSNRSGDGCGVRCDFLVFRAEGGSQVFVVECGFCRDCGGETRIGLRRWLFSELAGEIWVDGEGCGVRFLMWKCVLGCGAIVSVFGWFLGVIWVLGAQGGRRGFWVVRCV